MNKKLFRLMIISNIIISTLIGLLVSTSLRGAPTFAGNLGGGGTTLQITSISPSSVVAGGDGFQMKISGTGFRANSILRVMSLSTGNTEWDGSHITTFVNSNRVLTDVIPLDIGQPTTYSLIIFNPDGSGGGTTSNTVTFVVRAQ